MSVNIVVTSTGKNCPWARHCIYSVANQKYDGYFSHVYIAADRDTHAIALDARQRGNARLFVEYSEKTVVENVYTMWQKLPPDVVIVWLDGDDWLIGDNVLSEIGKLYWGDTTSEFFHTSKGVDPWLTYGSFECTDRTRFPNLGTHYGAVPPREDQWRASHLKTFRAGLVQQVRKQDLQRPTGSWTEFCTDQVFMLPMLEMAGDHYAVIETPLMQYNVGASMMRAEPKNLQAEAVELRRIRALPRYTRLTRRPF